MKKIVKILFVIVVLLMVSACGTKKIVSEKEIESKFSDLGYVTSNLTTQIEDSSVSKLISATNDIISVEYYVFKSTSAAKQAYDNNKKSLEQNKEYKVKEKTKNNYVKTTQTTKDFYNVIINSKKSLIYLSVGSNHKKEADKLLRELGF